MKATGFAARPGMPVYISASGPKTLELAGRVADGVILLVGLFPDALSWAVEHVQRGADQAGWLARLRREHDNLLEALRWSEERGEAETQVRLAGALWRFWWVSGSGEARRWLESSLERSEAVLPSLRARVLDGAGTLAWDWTGALSRPAIAL